MHFENLPLWSIGPGIFSAVISVVTHAPRPPGHYKRLIPPELGVAHVTIEVNGGTDLVFSPPAKAPG